MAVDFLGDYSTGDWSQWRAGQWTGHDGYTKSFLGTSDASIIAIPNPVSSRPDLVATASQFRVLADATVTSTERSEVYVDTGPGLALEGAERWYGWATRFPSSGNANGWWPDFGDWNRVIQFEQNNAGIPIFLGVDASVSPTKYYFEVVEYDVPNVPGTRHKTYIGNLAYDAWYIHVLRVRWSSGAAKGLVQLWVNDVEVVPATQLKTLPPPPNDSAYFKQGIYRAHWTGGDNTVWHAAARIGGSRFDVDPGRPHVAAKL